MTTEKRVLVAAALSAVVLFFYAQMFSRASGTRQLSPPASKNIQQSVNKELIANNEQGALRNFDQNEPRIILESPSLRLWVGRSSAAVSAIELRAFRNLETGQPLKLGGAFPMVSLLVGNQSTNLELTNHDARKAVWEKDGTTLSLELHQTEPTFSFSLTRQPRAAQREIPQVGIVASWSRVDQIAGQYNVLEVVAKTEKDQPWQKQHLYYRGHLQSTVRVPRGTALLALSERYFCQVIKPDNKTPSHVSVLPAKEGLIAARIDSEATIGAEETASYSYSVYVGPRDFFQLGASGFEDAFPVGWLGQIGLALMWVMKGIASVTRNYGVAIIALAALVTVLLSPFTMISFRSMKKMQQLQPKINQLKQKFEKDPKRMNKELFALFREHRVSPMSGCLPMLLPLPVFFALWSSISHVVELRGARFLWIEDLSLPDRLAKLPFGIDLNLLPVVMTAAMYVQSKISQKSLAATSKSPFTGPMMSIIFGVMFYQVPSGLVLYWLTNTLVSILSYKLAKI